eukprot:CAMPEP_0119566450 /NCGR_PEP_ID=MMETSP1352-20130426/33128_1 /TAXON_ID=265584 /ORGANISM="Stauroneis constricta, Strain CCMP1120" /LENGTH=99 /DNA_ID=CAMNT_0007615563 /DNA_START=537 /DNA_END=836 /DNA_ORIENTATION=+
MTKRLQSEDAEDLMLPDGGAPYEESEDNLYEAASNGHLDVVRHLVDTGKAFVDFSDKQRRTPLHEAASNGHLLFCVPPAYIIDFILVSYDYGVHALAIQ